MAAGVVPFDTTGLPPGAGFGPTVGLGGDTTAAISGTTTGFETAAETRTGELGEVAARKTGPLTVGQSLGPRYHIIKLLGVGGMGAVYQAWDAELGVAVALKVIRTDRRLGTVSAEAEKRFKTELLLARQVTHKHVVRIHDINEIDGIKYITMPYVQGDDLATLLRREGKLPIGRAMRLARQIADGLRAAHEAGVVHRDLKPPNIMIGGKGHDEQALIMDFGISASVDEHTSGAIVGTLEYMSPEQGTGKTVDARSDMYAFGVILYEMLTGPRPRPPTGPERVAQMRQRFEAGLPPIRTLDEAIPEPLAQVITRCLERDPSARYQTTEEMCEALAALDDAGELIPIPARISKRMMAALALVVVALLIGTYMLTRRAILPVKQHDPVSVLIADFQNTTGDPTFDRTLEPMLRRALEGAGFINAIDRTGVAGAFAVPAPAKLDDVAARELAVKQGVGVVLAGFVQPRGGGGYTVSVKATESISGKQIAEASARASSKDQVLGAATKLMAGVRRALGDETSESAQLFAMTSVSVTSLDVVKYYAAAREAASNGRFEESRQNALKAVELDPKLGIGYQLAAVASNNLKDTPTAEQYIKQALRYLDSMTERERYATRAFSYRLSGDYQQCVKENRELIARYSADVAAHNQLALCSTYLRDLPTAVNEMRRAVEILPNRVLYRGNLAVYSDYASDFRGGEKEARAVRQPVVYPLLALAFAQLGQGRVNEAADTYQQLSKVNALGASFATSGLGDLAIYEGRFADAVRILEEAVRDDLAAKNPDRAARKFASLAYVQMARGQKAAAVAAVEKVLANSKAVQTRFLAARTFVELGELVKARPLIDGLAAERFVEPRAYAKILEGEAALKNGKASDAVSALSEANKLLDTWIGRFELGRAYFAAGEFLQADSEFDNCLKRRGEALSLFLDEWATYGYLPAVYYYQGRVREELKTERFADSYRQYLDIRGNSSDDPLVPEVHRRAGL